MQLLALGVERSGLARGARPTGRGGRLEPTLNPPDGHAVLPSHLRRGGRAFEELHQDARLQVVGPAFERFAIAETLLPVLFVCQCVRLLVCDRRSIAPHRFLVTSATAGHGLLVPYRANSEEIRNILPISRTLGLLEQTRSGFRVMCSPTFRMTCYYSFGDARFLHDDWDHLAANIGGDLFATFDWCAIWWKHFGRGRRLEIYVARAGEELVAVVPLFRETLRWGPLSLRVIRLVGCDHCITTCHILIHPDWYQQVASVLMDALDGGGKWDLIHLAELPGYFSHGHALAEALRCSNHSGRVVYREAAYPHMVFDVPDSFEEYLKQLSAKERRNLRRDERRLDRAGRVERCSPTNRRELRQIFPELVDLHGQYWHGRGRLGHFAEWPHAEQFHREIAEVLLDQGRLALVIVRQNGRLLAAEYCARFGERIHWIISSRRPQKTCRIGFSALLNMAMCTGAKQIDALPGYYDYKRRLGARCVAIKTVTVFARKRLSTLRVRVFRSTTWVISLIYHRIWFWHLAPWLRIKLPNVRASFLNASLWQPLIRTRFLVVARRERHGDR